MLWSLKRGTHQKKHFSEILPREGMGRIVGIRLLLKKLKDIILDTF